MAVIRYNCKTNEEWRQERCHSIGASAVATVMGLNKWQTPYELAVKMREELKGNFDYSQNIAMMRGHAYEQGVAELFSWQTGKQIIKSSSAEYLLRREDIPFMHCSPDRTYWINSEGMKHGKNAEANKGILECKTTRQQIDPDNLPLSWLLQLQVQLGIGGYSEGYIAWDIISNADGFGYKRFEFSPELFDAAVEACREFWQNCIVGGNDPDPINAADVVALYPRHIEGKTLTADVDTIAALDHIKDLKAQAKVLDDEIAQLTDSIKAKFTDEEAMIDNDGNVLATFKTTSGRTTIDSKKLKNDYPDIYAVCCKTSAGSRTLLIK